MVWNSSTFQGDCERQNSMYAEILKLEYKKITLLQRGKQWRKMASHCLRTYKRMGISQAMTTKRLMLCLYKSSLLYKQFYGLYHYSKGLCQLFYSLYKHNQGLKYIAEHRHQGRCHRHRYFGINHLCPVPKDSGTGLGLLIPVPE